VLSLCIICSHPLLASSIISHHHINSLNMSSKATSTRRNTRASTVSSDAPATNVIASGAVNRKGKGGGKVTHPKPHDDPVLPSPLSSSIPKTKEGVHKTTKPNKTRPPPSITEPDSSLNVINDPAMLGPAMATIRGAVNGSSAQHKNIEVCV
jgi:hypothetical protein